MASRTPRTAPLTAAGSSTRHTSRSSVTGSSRQNGPDGKPATSQIRTSEIIVKSARRVAVRGRSRVDRHGSGRAGEVALSEFCPKTLPDSPQNAVLAFAGERRKMLVFPGMSRGLVVVSLDREAAVNRMVAGSSPARGVAKTRGWPMRLTPRSAQCEQSVRVRGTACYGILARRRPFSNRRGKKSDSAAKKQRLRPPKPRV
jgi:hypothetical protein